MEHTRYCDSRKLIEVQKLLRGLYAVMEKPEESYGIWECHFAKIWKQSYFLTHLLPRILPKISFWSYSRAVFWSLSGCKEL